MARKKKSTEEPQNTPQGDADDTFGLPDLDYKPLDRDEPAVTEQTSESTSTSTGNLYEAAREEEKPEEQAAKTEEQPSYSSYSQKPESSDSILPKVLGVILVLALVGAAAWYFGFYKPQKDKEEKDRLAAEKKKIEDARLAEEEERLRREAEQRRLDSIANATPKEGTFETLVERTGKYYVVVGSAIDDDLINDYARKLSVKGVSSKIIPPFGKVKFYRIAVAEGDTFQGAQETANSMKAEYGDAVWVLKY